MKLEIVSGFNGSELNEDSTWLEIYFSPFHQKFLRLYFLLFSTIFCYLLLDFHVKTGTRFSLRDKWLLEISKVDCSLFAQSGGRVVVRVCCTFSGMLAFLLFLHCHFHFFSHPPVLFHFLLSTSSLVPFLPSWHKMTQGGLPPCSKMYNCNCKSSYFVGKWIHCMFLLLQKDTTPELQKKSHFFFPSQSGLL